MLNVGRIENGIVIDHITAGNGMQIYEFLELGKLDSGVAIIKNAKSNKYGKKDIIKIDSITDIDFDVLGFIDDKATVCIIKNGEIEEKKKLLLPPRLVNVIKCKNPRCITSIETTADHIFILHDVENHRYRCNYCEQEYDEK